MHVAPLFMRSRRATAKELQVDPTLEPTSTVRPNARRARMLLAAVVGAALAVTGVSSAGAAGAAEQSAPTDGLIAEYLFDQTVGASVANSAASALGPATVVNGSDGQWTGSSLVFSGGAKTSTGNWVRLPDGILSDKTSATVTIETKLDVSMKNSWNFLWNIGSNSTTQYYFASVRDNPRTAITASGSGEVNARSGAALSADRWYSLTSVIDGAAGRITFFVDGVEVASTATSLTPASITNQSLNTIGRAPYPDPLYKGEVSTFRVYDRALSPGEVKEVSDADAALHASSFEQAAQSVLDGVAAVTIDDSVTTLPTYGGPVSWTSADPALTISEDGLTVAAEQSAPGGEAVSTTMTATATVRGTSVSREVAVTVLPATDSIEPYGYAMVHFIEDSAGYAEKIYLDISRGNNPEQWDPLNGGNPILASNLGTTGVRDPYLTYNPETETYYIIATDLRVFGGDRGITGCLDWCHWSSQGSTKLNVWESKDLVTWSDLRQFDVATAMDGPEVAELGMAWAPEATWVDDYNDDGSGAFVLYWSSNVYSNPEHSGSTYSRILWASTTDFTQETYEYGGVFIDAGGNTIDTTIIQDDGKTYRITKDNSQGKGIYMESTGAADWWEPSATWTQIQTRVGAVWAGDNAGGVEGPAVFKRHGEDQWYLYVDVIPSTGYRPMETTDLDAGWTQLVSSSFSMTPSTKHGGIVPLTRGGYDAIREADATGAVTSDLGSVELPVGADENAVREALLDSVEVTLAHNRGISTQPIEWDLSDVAADVPGTYEVTGSVRTIGASLNQWVGEDGSSAWNAPGKQLHSSTAITVTADVVVVRSEPSLPVSVTADTRCVAGKVVLTVRTINEGDVAVSMTVETSHGSKTVESLESGKSTSAAFSTRQSTIPAGMVEVTVTAGEDSAAASASYAAGMCD